MKRLTKLAVGLAAPAIFLCLVLLQIMCRGRTGTSPQAQSDIAPHEDPITATVASTMPAGPTSIRISVMMVVHKQYALLAKLAGNRNSTTTDLPYAPGKNWWDNPMVVFQDPTFPKSALKAGSNSEAIAGQARSRDVSIQMTLVPHADVTLKTVAASDCIQGTLTATITTASEYYDGRWTDLASAADKPVSFTFDTCKSSGNLRPMGSETRALPPFSFERYTRGHEKWEPKSAWPTHSMNGDWRCTIYVKNAKLVLTGSKYIDPTPGAPPP